MEEKGKILSLSRRGKRKVETLFLHVRLQGRGNFPQKKGKTKMRGAFPGQGYGKGM